jgi:hypothetical protein
MVMVRTFATSTHIDTYKLNARIYENAPDEFLNTFNTVRDDIRGKILENIRTMPGPHAPFVSPSRSFRSTKPLARGIDRMLLNDKDDDTESD